MECGFRNVSTIIRNRYMNHIKLTSWNQNRIHFLFSNVSKMKTKYKVNYSKFLRKDVNSGSKSVKMVTSTVILGGLFFKQGISVAWCKQANLQSDILPKDLKISTNKNDFSSKFDWKSLFKVLKPQLIYLFIAIGCSFVVAIMNIKIPLLLGNLINCLQNIASSIEDSARTNYLSVIKVPVIKLIASYLIQGLFTYGYITALSTMGENIASRLRTDLFSNIIHQDISFFDSHKTHEIMSRLTSDIQEFKSSFKLCIGQGLKAIIQTGGCVVSLYLLSPRLTGFLLILVPSIITIGTFLGSGLRKLSRKCQAQVAKAADVAGEAIGNVRTVRAFAMEAKENSLYSDEVELASQFNRQLGSFIGIFQGLSIVALNGIVLSVIGVGGLLMTTGDISAGNLMSFLVATQTIQRSLMQMSVLFGQFVRGMSAGSRVFEYMNLVADIPVTGGIILSPETLKGNLEFRNVTFSYPTRPEQVVLKKMNLIIKQGSVVALCGPSGSGKSTIASLIERFYEVTTGSIKLDGHDISLLNPTWLRGEVLGFISQEPVLFATSILENIRYGRPNASDEEVYEAAKIANADNFIKDFPRGYSTVLGERGVTLSGGQKQRIAIARALIKNPSILILDEATSALDAESEKVVQDALDKVVKGRTVLVIAHRLSTIKNADMITVLCGGVIAESGTHSELIKKRGVYWQLVQQQETQQDGDHR